MPRARSTEGWKSIYDFHKLAIDFQLVNRRRSLRKITPRELLHVMKPIYLDYSATAPMDPRVFEAMRPYFLTDVGNAGSRTHVYGRKARNAVDRARGQVAEVLGAKPEEIIFTSGATESDNIALLGLMRHALKTNRRHILASSIEHEAVLEPLGRLRDLGFEIELVPVTAGGYIEPDAVRERLRPDTLVVSIMHANNETGVLQPVVEVSRLLAESGVLFHTDAAQTFGKEVESLRQGCFDFVSMSGHKIQGPVGIGALYVRRRGSGRTPLEPIMLGGDQEMGRRPGTLPVALIVGFGRAAELAALEHQQRNDEAEKLKRAFLVQLQRVDLRINGDLTRAQPHVLNVSFPGVDSQALMLALRSEIAISNGAACTSSGHSASYVLKSMGLSEDLLASAVRLSWGPGVMRIPHEALIEAISKLRC
jgi:cysteine desulfurase